MFVRLAFAVAAHLDSEILIADEVLAVGDIAFQKKALGKMNDLSTNQGRTVLFVSHNIDAVKQLCKSGILLDKGRIALKSDSVYDIINNYLYGASIVGRNILHWENDGSLNAQELAPNSMKLTERDGSEIVSPIASNREYVLEFEFTTSTRSRILQYEFNFYTEEGVLAFSASPFYSIEDYSPRLGKNRVACVIPANLLNNRSYRIELQAGLHCVRWILEPGRNAPQLFMNVEYKESYNPFIRPPIEQLSPRIDWSV
jgi:lipopolysaccharide transport system ATP-binding protein